MMITSFLMEKDIFRLIEFYLEKATLSASLIRHRVKYGLDYFLDHFLDHFFGLFLDHFEGGKHTISTEGGVG